MNDDVIIPAETARRIAAELRLMIGNQMNAMNEDLVEWADLLDPPPQSLRDEVELCLRDTVSQWQDEDFYPQTDAVLAIVRRHVEALSRDGRDFDGYIPEEAWEAGRDDVLRLLGTSGE